MSDDTPASATGKDRAAWFALLDSWGAERQGHTAIARHLVETHGVSGGHAQSVSVGYEQERGLRELGQSSGGDRQVGTSRTVNAPADRCTAALADEELRRRWLPDGEFDVRPVGPGSR
ncbi:hypothetical protein ACFU51_11000 [Streptomyces sp. NPDC057430]|uniref:hypothetical protein n=1 Tax=Streptomyces sp. NPDC057430 TaxID=3346131 RepID=UPI00367F15DB